MSEACCPATTRAGQPCAAPPLPGSAFCLFHDPAHQQALAASRSKGGATPRRRTRRYPLLLDYRHVAELLSDLFMQAVNEPAPLDAPRLRALTGLAAVLLKAVGRPKGTYEIHLDRDEPAPNEPCLLRLYPPESPETTRLRAADAELEAQLEAELDAADQPRDPADPSADPSDPSNPSDSSNPTPDPDPPSSCTRPSSCSCLRSCSCSTPAVAPEQALEQAPKTPGTGAAPCSWLSPAHAGAFADPAASLIHEGSFPVAAGRVLGASWRGTERSPAPRHSRRLAPGNAEQATQQGANREETGTPATDPLSPPTPVSPAPTAQPSTPPACVVVETPDSTTLSVPGIPILLSLRRIPGPFD